MQEQPGAGPNVVVGQNSQVVGPDAHLWVVSWRIQNLEKHTLQIQSARLPHSRFRSDEKILVPILEIQPGDSARIELPVSCNEPAGTVVENAFLILRAQWKDQPWLILARLRMAFDEKGTPKGKTEVITTQPVGFSIQMGENDKPLG